MALGFGQKQQTPNPQGYNNPPTAMGGDTFNLAGKDMDVEFGKHIFKVNEYRAIFYEIFAGWREVDDIETVSMFGKSKTKRVTSMMVDYDSRICNESGSNYLYNRCMPLIGAASTSAKLSATTIYNNWKGNLLTCRMTMLSQYYFPKLRCTEGMDRDNGISGCEYVTESSSNLREHFRSFGHSHYMKKINTYGLDVDRYPEVATTLANMSTITFGGLEGFKTRQITENYVSTNSIQQQMAMAGMGGQPTGWVDKLLGRNPNMRS